MKDKKDKIVWKVYPTDVLRKVAEKHGIPVWELTADMALGTVSKEIMDEIEEEMKNY